MRYSKQRDEILNIVLESCEHPTARMVYEKIKNIIPNISLGTVYRNLNVLSENGDIKKILTYDGDDRFDKTLTNHNHIHCVICGKVSDIELNLMNVDYDRINKETGFKVTECNFNIKGICQDCIKERNY